MTNDHNDKPRVMQVLTGNMEPVRPATKALHQPMQYTPNGTTQPIRYTPEFKAHLRHVQKTRAALKGVPVVPKNAGKSSDKEAIIQSALRQSFGRAAQRENGKDHSLGD